MFPQKPPRMQWVSVQWPLLYRLEERIGAAHTLADDKRWLHHRQKQKHKAYEQLGQDIMCLANHIYRSVPYFAEQEAWDAFIRALPQSSEHPSWLPTPNCSMKMHWQCYPDLCCIRSRRWWIGSYREESVHCTCLWWQWIQIDDEKCHGKGHVAKQCRSSGGTQCDQDALWFAITGKRLDTLGQLSLRAESPHSRQEAFWTQSP